MPACTGISENIINNCANPLTAGVQDEMIFINYADWRNATITKNSNPLIIENIVLASGILGYRVEGKLNSNVPSFELAVGEFGEQWKHRINFKVFDKTGAVKTQIEKIASGRFVVVVENKNKGAEGNRAFEVFGSDAGLVREAITNNSADTATQGSFDITISSSDKSLEDHVPATLYITSYAASKAVFDSLVA